MMAAMTVRMSDEETELLRQQAALEQRSMNEVVVLAIRDRVASRPRREVNEEEVRRLIGQQRQTLDLLAR
jgi:hypothetical protein